MKLFIKQNFEFAKKNLFPICRSITGNGIKKSLLLIKKKYPKLKIKTVSTNTKAFDWKVPPEWNIRDAYVLDQKGNKVLDFKINNLHLVGFSQNINSIISKKELLKRLHYRKDIPNAIPYVTSYYKKYWGFCTTYNHYKQINKNYKTNYKFKVFINVKFNYSGKLRYGELILKGKSKKEILVSTYICHPSMANNELSGPIVSMSLIKFFSKFNKLNKTIRFIFIPETIGSIVFLSQNLKYLKKWCIGGYNLTCIGDDRNHSCLLSKYENSPSDKCLIDAYSSLGIKFKKYSFLRRGSDERQYNSPGIDLGITSIFRSKYGEYKEYHTSLDNFDLVTLKGITGGFNVAKKAISLLLNSEIPFVNVLCEPKLSKINLYPTLSKVNYKFKQQTFSKKLLNFIQYCDGRNNVIEIARLINLKKKDIQNVFNILKKNKIIY